MSKKSRRLRITLGDGWQDPSEASAYSTGFGALPPRPSAGGSSTVNAWVAVRTAPQ